MKKLFFTAAGTVLLTVASIPSHAQDNGVTIVLPEELDIVDPCESSRSNVGRVLLQNISETMTELVPGSGLEARLAESWEDQGGGTWRFNLRSGVKFSDGSALDADDVAHTLVRIKSPDIVCEQGAKFFGGIDLTSNVIDETTIEITSDPAQPILPLLLSTVTITPSDAPLDKYIENPIGTGPYLFKEYARGQHIKLEVNPDYWGDKPVVEQATYVFRSDSAVAAAMVQTGEADIAPNIAVQDATNSDTDYSYPNSETVYLRLDNTMAPLSDKRVREALNYAVDREAFIGTILADGTLIANAMVPPSTIGYNHDLKAFPYDPEKAKSLLAEAKADGVPVDAEISLIGRTNNFGNVLETMEALLGMFQDVGFNMSLKMLEVEEWLKRYSQPFPEDRPPEIVQAQHDNANGDPVFSMYFKYDTEGLQSGVRDADLDAKIADATAATGSDREEQWKDVFKYVHTDIVADVLLFHMVGFSRVNERLNFEPTIRTNSELQLSQISFK
ncbi:MAG: hypothetical protein KTR32_13895 [Granulosicoccus sp.]|nr:hypothetical protein [Granulosicoccus sp.]